MIEKDHKKRVSKKFRAKREKPEFNQQIVDIARVTRVMAGGKRMRFRVCLVIGDKKGRVSYGLAKGADVPLAVQKAYRQAEKSLTQVTIVDGTIPHEVRMKKGASKILLKPAPEGTGIIAGGACRMVLEMSGIPNVVAKILGTNNKVSNVKTTIAALQSLKSVKVKGSKEVTDKKSAVKKTTEVKPKEVKPAEK